MLFTLAYRLPHRDTAFCTIISNTGRTSAGEVRIARRISAVAFCCSRASSRSWVRHAISVSRPVARPRTLGALRRFCTTSLRCRAFVGSPPALERRLIAFPKAQDKALWRVKHTGSSQDEIGPRDAFKLSEKLLDGLLHHPRFGKRVEDRFYSGS